MIKGMLKSNFKDTTYSIENAKKHLYLFLSVLMQWKKCIHSGGLASSIVTKQRGDMALVEGNIEVFNGNTAPIDFAKTMEDNAYGELWEILPSIVGKSALPWKNKHGDRATCKSN